MGLRKCEYCDGKGRLPCPDCRGRKGPQAPTASRDCARCEGKGEVRCSGCAGGGIVDMPTWA